MKEYRVTFRVWYRTMPGAYTAETRASAEYEQKAIEIAEQEVRDYIGDVLKDITFWEIEEIPPHLLRWGESMYGGYYADISTGGGTEEYEREWRLRDLRKVLKDKYNIEHLPNGARWDN